MYIALARHNTLPNLDNSRIPLFVGAGVIRSAAQIEQYAAIPDLAVQTLGSYSTDPNGGNDPDDSKIVFSYDVDTGAAYNAIGLKNCGRDAAGEFLPDAIKRVHKAGQAVIIAVTSLSHENPEVVLPSLAEWAMEMGADGIEINGSCPNEKAKSGVMCTDIQLTTAALRAVRRRVGSEMYLTLKVSALSENSIDQYKRRHLPIDGVTAINNCRRLSPVNKADPSSRVIEVNDGYAGQSGPIIRGLAIENLQNWRGNENIAPYDVWSIGGLDNGRQVYSRVHVMGAVAAGSAQALYRSQDPAQLVAQWAKEYKAAAMAWHR